MSTTLSLLLSSLLLSIPYHAVYSMPNGSPICNINKQAIEHGHGPELQDLQNLGFSISAPVEYIYSVFFLPILPLLFYCCFFNEFVIIGNIFPFQH